MEDLAVVIRTCDLDFGIDDVQFSRRMVSLNFLDGRNVALEIAFVD